MISGRRYSLARRPTVPAPSPAESGAAALRRAFASSTWPWPALDVGLLGDRGDRVAHVAPGALDVRLDLLRRALLGLYCLAVFARVFAHSTSSFVLEMARSGTGGAPAWRLLLADQREDAGDGRVDDPDDQRRQPARHGGAEREDEAGGDRADGVEAEEPGAAESTRAMPTCFPWRSSPPWPARSPAGPAWSSDPRAGAPGRRSAGPRVAFAVHPCRGSLRDGSGARPEWS